MSVKQVLKQLKTLNIEPRESWRESTRASLILQIQATSAPVQARETVSMLALVFKRMIPQNMVLRSFTVVVLVLLIVSGGYITTVSAAAGSLPGDTLYVVKRVDEGVRLGLTKVVSIEKAGELELSFAHRRIAEAEKILTTQSTSEVKNKQIKKVVNEAQKNVENVQKQASTLASQGKGQEAASLATKVDEQAKIIQQVLEERKAELLTQTSGGSDSNPLTSENQEVQDAIGQTSEAVNAIAKQAVDIILETYLAGTSTFAPEVIAEKVKEKLSTLTHQAEAVIGSSVLPPREEEGTPDAIGSDSQTQESSLGEPTGSTSSLDAVLPETTPSQGGADTGESTGEHETTNPAETSEDADTEALPRSSELKQRVKDSLLQAQKLLNEGKISEAIQKIKESEAALMNFKNLVPSNTVDNKSIEGSSEIRDNTNESSVPNKSGTDASSSSTILKGASTESPEAGEAIETEAPAENSAESPEATISDEKLVPESLP